jgi:hypothetical protein
MQKYAFTLESQLNKEHAKDYEEIISDQSFRFIL